ncbi:MAG TPA: RidA family protein [Erysipelothrix sp.]|jgi:2-iminobutanoate/2-iminopropanoate deaminase|nr:RidA family protein [Erysipelothrix sp.]
MLAKSITSIEAPQGHGPYSPALKVGDFVFISGQLPLNEDNTMVSDDVSEQSMQVIRNLVALLSEIDLELRHIVKTTVYLSDHKYLEKFDQIYATYFSNPYPARTVVEIKDLAYGAKIAIDCVALDTLAYEAQFAKKQWEEVPEHDCEDCPDGTCDHCL